MSRAEAYEEAHRALAAASVGRGAPRERLEAWAALLVEKAGGDADTLRALHVEDLVLVERALQGERAAHGELERRLVGSCRAGALRVLGSDAAADEALQRLRERLLLGGGGTKPRLLSYSGRGPLAKWLRAVGMNVALELKRREHPERQDEDALVELASLDQSPDARVLQARDKVHFQLAFKDALRALEPQLRTLLRMRYVDGLSLDDSAKAFGVHRTTAMRWLEKAHQQVLDDTRAELRVRLRISPKDLNSLVRVLELSLAGRLEQLLASKSGEKKASPAELPGKTSGG